MKAEELMLGDWVLRNNEPFLVEMLGNKFIQRLWITDGEGYSVLEHSHNLSPIPITPEILDKNGWTDDESDIYHISDTFGTTEMFYDEDLGEWDLDIVLDSKFNKRVHLDIQYVHELQHALRLCKIEKDIEL